MPENDLKPTLLILFLFTDVISYGQSTSPQTKITGNDYGYLWWIIPFQSNNKAITATVATGNEDQYILVLPEMDMVVIFTGGAYNSNEDKLPFKIMNDIFIPTFAINK